MLTPEIRGLIILAGSARPLEDVLLDQMTYVLSLSMPDPAVRQRVRDYALRMRGEALKR